MKVPNDAQLAHIIEKLDRLPMLNWELGGVREALIELQERRAKDAQELKRRIAESGK